MGEVTPRVGAKWGVGRTLFCGHPTCDGRVGGLAFAGLRRVLPVPVRPHPGSRDLREQAEAQAPDGAYAAAVWVVPEGFRFDPLAEAWRTTRRGGERLRRVRDQGDAPAHRATHRERPDAAGATTYAAAIPLPAAVLCPQNGCGRRNAVTLELLDSLFARLAADLNATALEIRDDPSLGTRWLADRVGMSVEEFMVTMEANATLLTRLALVLPEWRLLDAACAGRPVEATDFFALDLPTSRMVAQPDAGYQPTPTRSSHGRRVRGD